mmetsp:Transcript_161624/g.513609  ORF Transcript_161624/g.513609 Transcript_161624/m.513609 type:complete len:325 (+) Transcript_161624:692-1666(+)
MPERQHRLPDEVQHNVQEAEGLDLPDDLGVQARPRHPPTQGGHQQEDDREGRLDDGKQNGQHGPELATKPGVVPIVQEDEPQEAFQEAEENHGGDAILDHEQLLPPPHRQAHPDHRQAYISQQQPSIKWHLVVLVAGQEAVGVFDEDRPSHSGVAVSTAIREHQDVDPRLLHELLHVLRRGVEHADGGRVHRHVPVRLSRLLHDLQLVLLVRPSCQHVVVRGAELLGVYEAPEIPVPHDAQLQTFVGLHLLAQLIRVRRMCHQLAKLHKRLPGILLRRLLQGVHVEGVQRVQRSVGRHRLVHKAVDLRVRESKCGQQAQAYHQK